MPLSPADKTAMEILESQAEEFIKLNGMKSTDVALNFIAVGSKMLLNEFDFPAALSILTTHIADLGRTAIQAKHPAYIKGE